MERKIVKLAKPRQRRSHAQRAALRANRALGIVIGIARRWAGTPFGVEAELVREACERLNATALELPADAMPPGSRRRRPKLVMGDAVELKPKAREKFSLFFDLDDNGHLVVTRIEGTAALVKTSTGRELAIGVQDLVRVSEQPTQVESA